MYIFGFATFFLWLTVYLSGFQLFNLEQVDESSKKIIYENTIFLLFLAIVIQLVYFTKNNIFLYNLNVQTKKEAEEEAEKRTVFLNTMSHEIRTPLNAINGLSYILKSENPEQHQIEYINSLHNNGKKLIQKLNNVLDYSKYQSDNFNLENEVCALDDNLKNYSKTFIEDCNQKKLQFVLDIPTPLPSVSIDVAKLHTILNNLLRNAMKFTKNGSVKLSVTDNTTLKRRDATKQHDKIQLDFVIKDTGKGISEENIALILADKGIYSKKNNKIGLGLAVVKNLKDVYSAKCEEKGIDLVLNIDNDFPKIQLDKVRYTQILNNLISNAIKFTHQGQVTLEIRKKEQTKNTLIFTTHIKDKGIGIATDKINTVWNKFSQATSATTRLYGGSGLGLPIVKNIVEAMGSKISIDSTLGEGSTFSFDLNREISHSKLKKTAAIKTKESIDLSNKKIDYRR